MFCENFFDYCMSRDFVTLDDYIPTLSAYEYLEQAVIRRVGSQWCIFSESGKRMGCYKSKKAAEKRLRQIEYFKNQDSSNIHDSRVYLYCSSCGAHFISRSIYSGCPTCQFTTNIIEILPLD